MGLQQQSIPSMLSIPLLPSPAGGVIRKYLELVLTKNLFMYP